MVYYASEYLGKVHKSTIAIVEANILLGNTVQDLMCVCPCIVDDMRRETN